MATIINKLLLKLLSILLLILSVVLLSVRPIPFPNSKFIIKLKGNVVKIDNPESNHIFIIVKNDHRLFFIKNGLQKGLNVKELSKKLMDKDICLTIVDKPWSIFDPWHRNMPVVKLAFENQEIFSQP